MKPKKTTKQFIEEAILIHGDIYDYSKSVYDGNRTKLIIICKIHGEFRQVPNSHLSQKAGCPDCTTEKRKKTYVDVYGVNNPSQSDAIKEKKKQTCLKNYGVDNPQKSILIKNKTENTNLDRYGIKNPSQKHIIDKLSLLKDKDYISELYNCNRKTSIEIANELGVCQRTILNYMINSGIDRNSYTVSSHEIQLQNFLNENGIEFKFSDRKTIKPKELDIYIPKYNLAIELNGVYWHSLDSLNDTPENRKKHINKTQACINNNIELLQFNDIEWIYKQDIVKSMILNKCGLTKNKIFARKCSIDIPTKQEERDFFDKNHLQGFSNSSICYGLKYNNEFVCMISFRAPRYNKEFDYEIIRIASKLNTNVIGGITKLFKHFLKNNINKTIITYADRRYSSGNVYKKLGFAFMRNSNIGYKWVKNNILYNRVQFQKHKLKDKLEIFDESFSESQNMFLNGYRKLYDCGQKVYIMQ